MDGSGPADLLRRLQEIHAPVDVAAGLGSLGTFDDADIEAMLHDIENGLGHRQLAQELRSISQARHAADTSADGTWAHTTEFAEALRLILRLLQPEQRRGGSNASDDSATEILEVIQ